MRGLLTTQSQNGFREQIQKEMLARLAWKSRYAELYPSSQNPNRIESSKLPQLPADARAAAPPVTMAAPPVTKAAPPVTMAAPPVTKAAPPVTMAAPPVTMAAPPPPPQKKPEQQREAVPPLMRPVSPQSRQTLYQDSSHHGRGRSLYLRRRGHIRPEDKFDFPLLSSWEYGWRLGDYTLDYRTPSHARSSVMKNTFYARNGVLDSLSAAGSLG